MIKLVGALRQVGGFLWVLRFPPQKKIPLRHGWNVGESGDKYHNPKDFLDIRETTERLEIQITEKSFGKKKSKVSGQDNQNQLWSPMPEGENLNFDNNSIIYNLQISIITISDKPRQFENTYYWGDCIADIRSINITNKSLKLPKG